MSWQATAWAMEQRVGDPAAKLLLIAYANYADADGSCWPSQKTLAWDTEICERSVRTKTAQLVELGLIEVTPRSDPETGQQKSNFVLLQMGRTTRQSLPPPPAATCRPPRQLFAAHIEEPPLEPPSNLQGKEVSRTPTAQIRPSAPHKPIPSDRDFGDRLVITEFDLITADGSMVVTAEHFKELETKYPLIKNMRGMVHSAFRTWLADTPPKAKMFALETWLGRLSAEAQAKAKRKPRPAEEREAREAAAAEREAQSKRALETINRLKRQRLERLEAESAGSSG